MRQNHHLVQCAFWQRQFCAFRNCAFLAKNSTLADIFGQIKLVYLINMRYFMYNFVIKLNKQFDMLSHFACFVNHEPEFRCLLLYCFRLLRLKPHFINLSYVYTESKQINLNF